MELIKILLVDDHHMILEGYLNVLSRVKFQNYYLKIETTDSCDIAYEKLQSTNFDIIFLDISFPLNNKNRISSGEDLGILIKREFPKLKIIILTVFEDSFRLLNLFSKLNPEGFLLKGETTSEELIRCLKKVLVSPPYYGSKISKLIHSGINQTFQIDKIDRIILHQLSLGTKTKDLTDHVHLSLRAIEDRKRKLKEIFGIAGKDNRALLDEARRSGYI